MSASAHTKILPLTPPNGKDITNNVHLTLLPPCHRNDHDSLLHTFKNCPLQIKKNKIKSNPKKYIQRPPLCYRSVLRKNEGRNLLKNISLLYCDWHLTVLSGVLTWMNLNDKLSFISNRALFTIEQHDYFMERKKRKNQSFPSIPRGTPDLSPGYDLPSLIHANRMALICSTGRFATPLNSGISYGMTPTSHGVQITFMLLAFSIRWQMTSPPFWDKADHLALQTTFWLTSRQKPAVFCLLVRD